MPRPNESHVLPRDLPFETIESYRLLRLIGEGGMGSVFEAVHVELNQHVALKIIRQDRHKRNEVERFRREMKAIGALAHPNIVRATDAGEEQGRLFLVMELLDGQNLHEIVKKFGPLQVADACELIRQTALGLTAIAAKERVHRDIKPKNLMLTHDPHRAEPIVKILDLGLALLHEDDADDGSGITAENILGTLDYLSPEQGRRSHSVDIRADIYSLGCTFYMLLTGEAPYPSPRFKTVSEKLDAHESKPLPPMPDFVPEGVKSIIKKMVAKQPTLRYQTPGEVAELLTPFAKQHRIQRLLETDSQTPSATKEKTGSNRADETPQNAETPNSDLPTVDLGRARRGWMPSLLGAFASVILLSFGMFAASRWWDDRGEEFHNDDSINNPLARTEHKKDSKLVKETPREVLPDVFFPVENTDPLTVPDYSHTKAGIAHDLLERAPTKLLWSKKDDPSSALYNPFRKNLKCESQRPSLMMLGRIVQYDYVFSVKFTQVAPVKDVGVFIGFTLPLNKSEMRTPAFQLVTLAHVANGAKGRNEIQRFVPRIEWNKNEEPALLAINPFKYQSVESLKGEQHLQIVVRGGIVVEIRLNGDAIHELTRKSPPASSFGGFGVSHHAHACTFRSATLVVNPPVVIPAK